MARWQPFPLIGGAYADDARPWSAQDTVNLLPEMAERGGARAPAVLKSVPGLVTHAATQNAPVRGLHDVEGALFAVVNRSLYRVQNGSASSLGTIPGVGIVSMAHNQITGGSEVVIATRSTAYVWNTATSLLTQITDEGFPGAKVVDFLDGYIMAVEPMGRYWFHSDLADATSYNTLDRSEAEAQPDKIVTGIVTHGDWLVFGERTAEFFHNTGETTGTFQRRDGTEMEVGCAGTHAVVRLDNSVLWLGHDGSVYRLDGYSPIRISTHAVEQGMADETWSECIATTFEDRGHKIAYFTFPNGRTWGFDVATGEWHRRQSKGMDRWRVNTLAKSRGRWYAGDAFDGSIYTVDWTVCTEKGEPMDCRRVAGGFHDEGNRVGLNALKLVIDAGQPGECEPEEPPVDTQLLVFWANGYRVWHKMDIENGLVYASTNLQGPNLEVRIDRNNNRVFIPDDAGIHIFAPETASDPIPTPVTIPINLSTGQKRCSDICPDTGVACFADEYDTAVFIKTDNTYVTVTGLDSPSYVVAVGDGRFAVYNTYASEILFFGPSNNYASALHTVTGKSLLIGMWLTGRNLVLAHNSIAVGGEPSLLNVDTYASTALSVGFVGNVMALCDAGLVLNKDADPGKVYVRNLSTGAAVSTIDYSGTRGLDDVQTQISDIQCIGNTVAILAKWQVDGSLTTYKAIHLADATTGAVLYTYAFDPGSGDEYAITANPTLNEFYVGSSIFDGVCRISASAPYTTTFEPTNASDTRFVDWMFLP